jgi:SAM-dependent methyltransferase
MTWGWFGERMTRWRKLHGLIAAGVLLGAVLANPAYGRDEDTQRRDVFDWIYSKGFWGKDKVGQGTSGPGSTMESTKLYRVFLQDFLAAHGIRSVVDAGCGDWQFSQSMDWSGIDYLGVDIVASVIEQNRRRHAKPNIRFSVADIVRDELPPADLLIVKDVLQHLSDADISRFLKQLPRYRHVLIVNDVDSLTLSAKPQDIKTGGFRPIDLTRPPHSLQGNKVLAWHSGRATQLVLHVARADARGAAAKPAK